MTDSPHRDAAADAAAWYARIRDQPGDRAARDAWVTADPARAAAWDRVARTDALLDLVRDDPRIAAVRATATQPARPARRWHGWAAAAALVGGIGVAGTVMLHRAGPDAGAGPRLAAAAPPARYATVKGEVRRIALPDGSDMTLDAASAARVSAPGAERRIALDAGRAMFAVAKDRAHPFVVTAGGTSVTALGTHFAVDRGAGATTVALVEGSVRVVTPLGTRVLTPGQTLTVSAGGIAVDDGRATDATGWTGGRLTFAATPLSDVAAALSRYETRRVVIRDAALARRPFSGSLKTRGGTEALVTALVATGAARVVARDATRIELARP